VRGTFEFFEEEAVALGSLLLVVVDEVEDDGEDGGFYFAHLEG
jgi:hypothetical protein